LERYIKPVARHFPYWALYAETDVGAARSREEKRAVVIFHRRPGPVRDFVHKRARLLPAGYQDFRQLDVERSNVPSFAAVFRQLAFSSSCPIGSYLDRAFHHVQNSDELRSGEDLRRGLGSATYWTWFLAGLRQFLDCGQVDRDNPYLACVKKVYREIKADTPTAKLFADDGSAMQRVKLRLESAKRMLDRVDLDRDPIVIFEAKQSSLPITLCDRETGQAIACHAFDGYHRLFFATLLGLPTLPYVKVITHESGFLDPTSA
jgi:hypothetical protein